MTEPAELLDSDEYFTCRLLCRMPKATCITRQTVGITYQGYKRHVPLECQDCTLGQMIKDGKETNKMEQTDQIAKRCGQRIAPCGNCGRVLPVQGFGLCGGCRAVTKTTPPERLEAALAAAKVRFNAPDFNGRAHSYRGRRAKLPAAISGAAPAVIPAQRLVETRSEIQERNPVLPPGEPTIIPITLRLTVEIAVRVSGIV